MKSTSIQNQITRLWRLLTRLKLLLFVALVAGLYGFIVWQAYQLTTAEPSPTDVSLQTTTTTKPSIDPGLADRIKRLEQTNVTVKALFDEARRNPFKE